MLIFLPLVIFTLYFACNDQQCISINPWNPEFLVGKSVPSSRRLSATATLDCSRCWLQAAYLRTVATVWLLLSSRLPWAGHSLRSFADTYLLSAEAARIFFGWFALNVRARATRSIDRSCDAMYRLPRTLGASEAHRVSCDGHLALCDLTAGGSVLHSAGQGGRRCGARRPRNQAAVSAQRSIERGGRAIYRERTVHERRKVTSVCEQ